MKLQKLSSGLILPVTKNTKAIKDTELLNNPDWESYHKKGSPKDLPRLNNRPSRHVLRTQKYLNQPLSQELWVDILKSGIGRLWVRYERQETDGGGIVLPGVTLLIYLNVDSKLIEDIGVYA